MTQSGHGAKVGICLGLSIVVNRRGGGFQTMLGAPMLREGKPIGVMALVRTEAQPFTGLMRHFSSSLALCSRQCRALVRMASTDAAIQQ